MSPDALSFPFFPHKELSLSNDLKEDGDRDITVKKAPHVIRGLFRGSPRCRSSLFLPKALAQTGHPLAGVLEPEEVPPALHAAHQLSLFSGL